jgi:ATP-binding cassette subfamily F protein uup
VTVLSARTLTKAYGPQTLFTDVSVTIEEGDRVGLLGINGSGKSTLLRVLAGLEPCDTGVIDRRKGARVLYLPQEPELEPLATARAIALEGLADWFDAKARHEAVTLAIDTGGTRDEVDSNIEEQAKLAERIETLGGWDRDHVAIGILHKLGIEETERPVGKMSGGERRRVALARVLIAEPDLAILDEPTNHLDVDTIEWLEEHLAAMRGAVLLVTHDRYVLDAVATRALELDNARLREFRGNYADYLEQKASRRTDRTFSGENAPGSCEAPRHVRRSKRRGSRGPRRRSPHPHSKKRRRRSWKRQPRERGTPSSNCTGSGSISEAGPS